MSVSLSFSETEGCSGRSLLPSAGRRVSDRHPPLAAALISCPVTICHITVSFLLPPVMTYTVYFLQTVDSAAFEQQQRAVNRRHAATHHPREGHGVPTHSHHSLWQAAQGLGAGQIPTYTHSHTHLTHVMTHVGCCTYVFQSLCVWVSTTLVLSPPQTELIRGGQIPWT